MNHSSDRRLSRLVGPLFGAMLAAVCALMLAGCLGGDDDDSASSGGEPVANVPPQAGGTLTYAASAEPDSLDPFIAVTDVATEAVNIQIFDQLVELYPGEDEPQPGLAESWEISDDEKTYTFTIREARFSNGDPVTTEDVVFSLNKAREHPQFSALFDIIRSVKATGDSEVVVELTQPTPAFLGYLAFPPPSIVPKAVYERLGPKEFAVAPVGSGAFTVAEYVKGQRIEFERNPHYWREDRPYLDRVIHQFVPDDNARVLQLRAGEVDIAENLPFSQLASLESEDSLKLFTEPIAVLEFSVINQRRPPLGEVEVRQALNYATPREQIQDVVFAGRGEIANSVLPKMRYWDESVEPYPFDLEQARELLAQSSAPDGFSVEILTVAGDQPSRQTAEILQETWGEIGIDVSIREADLATGFDLLVNGEYDLYMFASGTGNTDVAEQDELLQNLLTDDLLNTGYKSEEVEALVNRVIKTTDEEKRIDLLAEIQEKAYRDDPYSVPILFSPARVGMQQDVQGFDYVDAAWYRLDEIFLADE